jgi:hypothetical protein
VNLPPKERERRIKFQQKWLKLIQLMARISQQESRVSSVMEKRIRQETELWMVAHIDNNQRLALIEQVNKNRSRVMKFIFDKMTIWIKRIRWRIQRRKAMEVWRFLTIAKNIHFMRICIRKNSYRSKVLKIQMWWKQKIETVDSPSLIIQVKWAAREAFLIEQYNEFRFNKRSDKLAEKKRRKTSILVKGSSRGKSGLSKLSPKKKRKDMKKLEPILVEEVPKPREVTRYEALHLELTTGQVEGDDEAEFLKHKVPAPFRRAAIAKYLAEERELDRAEFKKYLSDTLRFKQDHHFKLMELQQRAKLGLDDEGWMKTHAPQIPYKSIFNLPSNTYLDALILNAQHKWVLSMAQSKLDAFSKPLRTEYAAAPSSEPSLASTTTNQPLSKILE